MPLTNSSLKTHAGTGKTASGGCGSSGGSRSKRSVGDNDRDRLRHSSGGGRRGRHSGGGGDGRRQRQESPPAPVASRNVKEDDERQYQLHYHDAGSVPARHPNGRGRFWEDDSSLATPTPVQQSDAENDRDVWYFSDLELPGQIPRRPTEIDVIRDWFVNIFQPVEKTADLVVTDFKFEQLPHQSQRRLALRHQRGQRPQHRRRDTNNGFNNGSSTSNGGRNNGCGNGGSSEIDESGNGSSAPNNGHISDLDLDSADGALGGGGSGYVGPPFRVLKKADVELKVGGKPKRYSVVIKVLPTDDPERHTNKRKFRALLKFSKEVQVYQNVIHSMMIYDEKRYPAACVEPPVPRCYLSQLDAQNDVLVLENLAFSGYRSYGEEHINDLDHCRVVLRRMAHFHAISTLMQRDSEMCLVDLFPFAVDAECFRQRFDAHVAGVKAELVAYLSGRRQYGAQKKDYGAVIDEHLDDLFWKLVELRHHPHDRRFCVLIHGCLDAGNIVFQYDEQMGDRPICAKFIDFSCLTVSSPVIDITYFLHRAVRPELAKQHHSALLQHYHRAHLEAVKSFGMHGFEMELETLLNEYQDKQDYGAMMGCRLRPAIFALQRINEKEKQIGNPPGYPAPPLRPSAPSVESTISSSGGRNGAETATDQNNESDGTTTCKEDNNGNGDDDDSEALPDMTFKPTVPVHTLRIDRELLPVDHRLQSHLRNLARACPCPCDLDAVVGSGRELNIAELSADSLEELHLIAQKQMHPGLRTIDCGGNSGSGNSSNSLKKLFLGLLSNSGEESSNSGSSRRGARAASTSGATTGTVNGEKDEKGDEKTEKEPRKKGRGHHK